MHPIITCENLNFEVPQSRILGLLGKNGTGKTTTINILNGYLKPAGGRCIIFGEDIRAINPITKQRIAITKQRIALLIEGHVQYAFMNIGQIERFYAAFYPRWKKEAYYELMNLLKVVPCQRIANMSCGQRSQVTLGLIMAQNADLLILAREIYEIYFEWIQGVSPTAVPAYCKGLTTKKTSI